MIGPFEQIPFKTKVAVSPLSSRQKKDSDARRVILDCSWPIGYSLNDGIDKDSYAGRPIKLTYPTVDDLARRVFELTQQGQGQGHIAFFKEDMDRAFHQIFASPLSVPLLGFHWRNQYYFDLVMVMGCHIAPYICQHTTDMIRYLHNQMGYFLLNYVDDFVGTEFSSIIEQSHGALLRLLRDLNIGQSESKSVPPPHASSRICW